MATSVALIAALLVMLSEASCYTAYSMASVIACTMRAFGGGLATCTTRLPSILGHHTEPARMAYSNFKVVMGARILGTSHPFLTKAP